MDTGEGVTKSVRMWQDQKMQLEIGYEDIRVYAWSCFAFMCLYKFGRGVKAGETHLCTCTLLPLSSFSYKILCCAFFFFFS